MAETTRKKGRYTLGVENKKLNDVNNYVKERFEVDMGLEKLKDIVCHMVEDENYDTPYGDIIQRIEMDFDDLDACVRKFLIGEMYYTD